jgi:hypothetical protein
MLHNHQVPLSLLALSCVAGLMVAALKPAVAEPKVLPLAQGQTAGTVEEVGYRYRRYRYVDMTAVDRFGTRYGEHVTWPMTSRSSLFDRVLPPSGP